MQRPSFPFFRLVLCIFALAPITVLPPHAMALPTAPTVVAGRVDFSQAGNQALITQHSRNAIVNWQSFDIAAAERVRLAQPDSRAALLARVTGGNPTQLLGQLDANGRLFLINERGILVGAGARIDTAAFMASTLDVADADFLRGNALTLQGSSTAGVVNLGTITAREGNIYLLAHTVQNTGALSAPQGAVRLAAGSKVYLASPDSALLVETSLPASGDSGAATTGVDNSGLIQAAQVQLQAAGGSLYDLAINQSGTIRATGTQRLPDGRVILTADTGDVQVSGQVSARNANGSGGQILVGGDYRGGNASVPNATRTTITSTAVLSADAASATAASGRIIVWSANTTIFNGTLSTRGSGGGFAEVSGKHTLVFRPASVLDLGRAGTLLLDPDAAYIGRVDPGNGVSFFDIDTLQNQLATTDVIIDTSTSAGDVTFGDSLAWSSTHDLTVRAGNNINLNADITAPAGSLTLLTGRQSFDTHQGPNGTTGNITQASSVSLTVATLTVGLNPDALVPDTMAFGGNRTGSIEFSGILNVVTLTLDLAGQLSGITAVNPANAIGTIQTSGIAGDFGSLDIVDGSDGLDLLLVKSSSTAGYLSFVTPGDLTLLSGFALSFDSTAQVVLASTGGSFINSAGASALGANAHFIIYSDTTAGTVTNGLTGTEEFSRTYAGNPPSDYFDESASYVLFSDSGITLPQLTYRASAATRLYGDHNPSFDLTVTGYKPGVTNDVTGAPDFSTNATIQSGVGTYTVFITQGTLASDNYAFNFVNGSYSVTPAPLLITPNNESRLYGSANPVFSAGFTGLKNQDNDTAVSGLTFSAPDATTGVGRYDITASGATAANYTITYAPGVLTINKAPLTLTAASDLSRLYGDDNPNLMIGLQTSGLVNNENIEDAIPDFAIATSAAPASNIGPYAITLTGNSANYDVTFVPGTLTITKAPLTVTARNQSRTYGADNPELTYDVTGFKNHETESVLTSPVVIGTEATPETGIGHYDINVSGAAAANYDLTFTGADLTITKAPLTVTLADATRHYGYDNPSFSIDSVTGLQNSDTQSVLTHLVLSTTANADSLPGPVAITGSATAANYELTFVPGTLSITKAPVTFSISDHNKVYGTPSDPLTADITGVRPGDLTQLRLIWALNNPDSLTLGAGVYDLTFNETNPSLATYYRQFYDLTFDNGSLTVSKAPLSLIARSVTASYGSGASTNGYEILGLRAGDSASVISGTRLNNFSLFSGAPVGSYPVTFASAGTAANYEITAVPGAINIQRRVIVINAPTLNTPQGLVPSVDPAQPSLVSGGPQFKVVGYVPSDTVERKSGDSVPIQLRLVPLGGTTLDDINASYSLVFNEPGFLNILDPVFPPAYTDPSILIVKIDGGFTLPEIPVIIDPPPIRILIVDYKAPLSPQDFTSIITGSTDHLTNVMKDFRNSTAYKNDYSPDQRKIVDDFVNGKLSAADLSNLMLTDPSVQALMMPIFASYAMDLVTNGAKTAAEKRLVYYMGEAAIEQRQALAAKVTEAHDAWLKADAEKSSIGLYGAYSMHLMPDVVSGAQTEVLNALIGGGIGGAVAGGGTAAAIMTPAVAAVIFPESAGYGAGTMAGAAGAAGPAAAVIGVAVIVTVIALTAIDASDKHKAAYETVLARAEETKPKLGATYVDFSLKPPKDDTDRAEVMTTFLQVFGNVFGG